MALSSVVLPTTELLPFSHSQDCQRTSSLSQLSVEDLKDLPAHWRCYMSPQGRRYYVNTTSNGKSQWNAAVQDSLLPKTTFPSVYILLM
ncbi:hypothetical protein EYF80_008013 [Liparis tanakae]|uniref:WW domain-containing protein n=1 Tax=Liparis tanakae TaxID=230148 RepID=A0A4Z2IVM3_9TELE|nr:hypothetical protein EYF80_008013 [Liparis tanakae]